MTKLPGFLLLLLTMACGGGSTTYEISSAPLGGVVGGEPWTFQTGDTDAFLSDDQFFAVLFSSNYETCELSARPREENSLILNIPKMAGDYPLSLTQNMTFVVQQADGPLNIIGIRGRLRVDEVSDTRVTGAIFAEDDDANRVDGTFEVEICP